jgi:Mn-dependent DtxR family transcriptional regulator
LRSKPTDGTAIRLTKILEGKYAVNVKDVARLLRISHRHAQRFVKKLEDDGIIFYRYRQYRYKYYSIRRNK